jgi:hypothetical protein
MTCAARTAVDPDRLKQMALTFHADRTKCIVAGNGRTAVGNQMQRTAISVTTNRAASWHAPCVSAWSSTAVTANLRPIPGTRNHRHTDTKQWFMLPLEDGERRTPSGMAGVLPVFQSPWLRMQGAVTPAHPVPQEEAMLDVQPTPWATDAHVPQTSLAPTPLPCKTSALLSRPAAFPRKRACLLVSRHAH